MSAVRGLRGQFHLRGRPRTAAGVEHTADGQFVRQGQVQLQVGRVGGVSPDRASAMPWQLDAREARSELPSAM